MRREARRDWQTRLDRARAFGATQERQERIAAAGLTDASFHRALEAAFLSWSIRRPQRWLPRRLRVAAFSRFGHWFADAFVRRWAGAS